MLNWCSKTPNRRGDRSGHPRTGASLTKAGLTKAGLTKAGLTKAGLTKAGLTKASANAGRPAARSRSRRMPEPLRLLQVGAGGMG
ncbi:hypothetical protein [Kribbella qitaiheensis]|uniref:hypothetical protein n=1 Tax=Kribbella qitaiheensis TaxID=1544730 RepID=UPI0016232D44|nr:hypothetical protein [Kribbella qitaiheensis]